MKNSIEAECDRYFQKIFAKGVKFTYTHHQEWAAADFAYIEDVSQEENKIYYSLRTGWWKNGKNYEYGIAMQQYRNEKHISGSKEEKERLRYEISEYSRELCEEIFAEYGKSEWLKLQYKDKNRLPDQNNLFLLFINGEIEDEVCDFFHYFIREFPNRLGRKYSVINLTDVN